MTIRFALLLCGTPVPPVLEKYGNYHKIFDSWLRRTSPVDVDFILDAFDVIGKMEYPPESVKYDAIIFTGSAATAYEDVEWVNKLVEYTSNLPRSKPEAKIIGICFGHQIIARAFNGTCVRNSQWDVGITEVRLTGIGRRIFDANSLSIQQMHRDHVPTVPSGFELLGSTGTCHNEGMVKYTSDESGKLAKLSDIHILTVQGHPEFTRDIVAMLVGFRAENGILTPECAQDAIKRNDELRDEPPQLVGKAVWQILVASPAEIQNTGGDS